MTPPEETPPYRSWWWIAAAVVAAVALAGSDSRAGTLLRIAQLAWECLLVLAVVRRLRTRPTDRADLGRSAFDAWHRAAEPVLDDWVRPLHLAAICLAPLVAVYLLVVVGLNSFAFHYSFWNDPAPSAFADGVAVVSLWVLALIAALSVGWLYVSLCRVPPRTPTARRLSGCLSSLRTVTRHVWWVVGGVSVVAVTSVIGLGVLLLPILAPAPFVAVRPFSQGYLDLIRDRWRTLALASAVAIVVAILVVLALVILTTEWSGVRGALAIAGSAVAAVIAIEAAALIAELGRAAASDRD